MDYMEIFLEYLSGNIDASTAGIRISKCLPDLKNEKDMRDYVKAGMCMTYFKRYQQYNIGKIKAKDLLLFMRDFVFFVGRFRFPRFVADIVTREGISLGVFVNLAGEIDITEDIPAEIKDNERFIHDVYQLSGGAKESQRFSSGDAYVKRFSVFSAYRSLEQKLAVHSALELPDDHTLMISLPTGGGKSLITQLLAAFEPKLTLVVVPTVSLANDQYLQARECIADEHVKKNVFCYDSKTGNQSLLKALDAKEARLIFTSPEAILMGSSFNKALRKAAEEQYIRNVVIDEAHIVPDWGQDFRPEFQIFSVVLKELRTLAQRCIRTYLLSATLSDDVVKVLFDLYASEGGNIQFRCDALREEPRYVVIRNHDIEKREKGVISMIKALPKPLIVYVIEPKTARKYCKMLNKEGFSNIHTYTGDTKDGERESLLEDWKNNEFDVMIATSAFGMGVDKSNVRTIIHACVPENLSRFYQEVGRAGRDGLPSLSVLSYYMGRDERNNDLSVAFGLVKSSVLTKEKIAIRLSSILGDKSRNIIEGDMVTADLNTIPTSFSKEEAEHVGNRNMCWNVNTLLLLHRQGYIDIKSARYDNENKTYLFVFRLNELDLLQDTERLKVELADDRQKEYDMRVEGYHKMAEIVHRTNAKCLGSRFSALFPYAQPVCSGCPVHPEGSTIREDKIRIRGKAFIDIEPDQPGRLLRRYMGPLMNLLVPVDDYSEFDISKAAEKADKLNLACMVYPDEYEGEINADCMLLKHSEFLEVADKIPWLLRNGMMIILCEDDGINNKIFEVADKDPVKAYRKIWCCKLNTRIFSRSRTINEFLNCHTRYLDNI